MRQRPHNSTSTSLNRPVATETTSTTQTPLRGETPITATTPTATAAPTQTTSTSAAASAVGGTRTTAEASAQRDAAPTLKIYPVSSNGYAGSYLELDGRVAASLMSAQGGEIRADLRAETSPRQLGAPRYADLTLQIVNQIPSALFTLVKRTLDGENPTATGRVVTVDSGSNVLAETPFCQARVESAAFPGQIPSKDAFVWELTLRSLGPVPATWSEATSVRYTTSLSGSQSTGKRLDLGLTKLRIDGLDCTAVHPTGPLRFQRSSSGEGALAGTELTVSIDSKYASPWLAWVADFVMMGRSGASYRKSGELTYYDTAGAQVFAVALGGIGVRGYTVATQGKEQLVTFELFFESARLS